MGQWKSISIPFKIAIAISFCLFGSLIVYGAYILLPEIPDTMGWIPGMQVMIMLCIVGGIIGAIPHLYTMWIADKEAEDDDIEDDETPEEE
jgi:hypothetical protein